MRRTFRRTLSSIGAGALVVAALVVLPATAAQAAPVTATAVYNDLSGPRFQPVAVPAVNGRTFNVQTNLWNKAVQGNFTVTPTTAANSNEWKVQNNNANSYFFNVAGDTENDGGLTCSTTGVPGNPIDAADKGCNWAGRGDPWLVNGARDGGAVSGAHGTQPPWVAYPASGNVPGVTTEFSNQIHAPASYPDIYLGCHWGQCSSGATPTRTDVNGRVLPGTPAGAPFPLQLSGVSQMTSTWDINVPTAPATAGADPNLRAAAPGGGGVWDASYDIWLDTNTRGCAGGQIKPQSQGPGIPCPAAQLLPTDPAGLNLITNSQVGQNDGAEVMIWNSNHGYQSDLTKNIIQPAGDRLEANMLGSALGLGAAGSALGNMRWDVWGGRVRSFDNGVRWNVISFVPLTPPVGHGVLPHNFDARAFLTHASTLKCATPNPAVTADNPFPSAITPQETNVPCLLPQWWITSVQAGFEIWNLHNGTDVNSTMDSTAFDVQPTGVTGFLTTGGRSTANGTPLINWGDTFDIVSTGSCSGATDATYNIAALNFAPDGNLSNVTGRATYNYPSQNVPTQSAHMSEVAGQPGSYTSDVPAGPMYDNQPTPRFILHSDAVNGLASTLTISMTCNGVAVNTTTLIFIDPSGEVMQTGGSPVNQATVTIFRSDTATVPTDAAHKVAGGTPNTVLDTVFHASNPSLGNNSALTDANGLYGWNVIPGFYRVTATKAGCVDNATRAATAVSAVYQVAVGKPIPTNVDFLLDCGNGPVGLPTTVVVRPPGVGQFGYCADVTVTNNTNAPVAWNTSFAVPGNQHINQHWNMVLTQVGNQATNVHADPSNPWNTVLQPGQSTTSTGFCAVP